MGLSHRHIMEGKLFILVALLSLVGYSCSDGTAGSNARLLASKTILNEDWLVQDRDISLVYTIYNVGSSAALKVHLSEEGFPVEYFQVVSGLLEAEWDRIAPGSNVSHNVVVKPLFAGYYNFTAAILTYKPYESAEEIIAFTSSPGEGGVISFKEFDKRFSPHYMDWAAFMVMTFPLLGIPFMLWYTSKSRYENIDKKSKKQ